MMRNLNGACVQRVTLIFQPWNLVIPILTSLIFWRHSLLLLVVSFTFPAAEHGRWGYGYLWVRYYAMDKGEDALGGTKIPKLYFQLPTCEKFWMQANVSAWEKQVNLTRPATVTIPAEPTVLEGPKIRTGNDGPRRR